MLQNSLANRPTSSPSCPSARRVCVRWQSHIVAQATGKSNTRAAKKTTGPSTVGGKGGKAGSKAGGQEGSYWSQFYIAITGFPFPLGPVLRRNTVRNEVERGSVWTFDQTQALEDFDVYTPVRMTIIKLASGGLWVHNPVAPTDECIRLVRELGCAVEHIVLGTFAYEHKQFVGPFSRRFPRAKVWLAPYQWSFPLNLPPQFFGIFPAGQLSDDLDAPWSDEIEQKVLLPPNIGVGEKVRLTEVAFFHRRSKTLIVTDAVIYVDDKPPEVIPQKALISSARDGFLARYRAGSLSPAEIDAVARPKEEIPEDTPATRRRGWQRMALLVLFFNPHNLLQPEASFNAFSKRLIVGPVVEALVYSKFPRTVRTWVDAICRDWDFRQIIPCHFTAPIKAGPADLRRAFAFAYGARSSADAVNVRRATRSQEASITEDEAVTAPAGAAAAGGPFAALGRLFRAPARTAAAQMAPPQRAATFLPEDMKTINDINNFLLATRLVRAQEE